MDPLCDSRVYNDVALSPDNAFGMRLAPCCLDMRECDTDGGQVIRDTAVASPGSGRRCVALGLLGFALGLLPAASWGEPETESRGRTGTRIGASASADLIDTLTLRFPALQPRMERPAAFEETTWMRGGRPVSGLAARRAASADGPADEGGALGVVFPRRASDPIAAEGEGVRVVLRPRGAAAAPAEVVDGKLVYVGLYEETDALHIVGDGWTEEYLHLRNEDAPRRFEYELMDLRGATSVRLENGEIQIFDDNGRGLVIAAPVVADASGRRSATAARWELSGTADRGQWRLMLHLDSTGLDYPLLLDPSFATGSMNTARYDGIGVLLHTGRVLVVEGWPPTQTTAELYDPATGTWTYTSPLVGLGLGRSAHAAVMLRDGRVLVIGGATMAGETSECLLYDPLTDVWSLTGPLPSGRQHHTATLLDDGRVLVAGGANTSATPHPDAWLYDPGAGTWSATGSMTMPRMRHGAALLQDGRVLVSGGATTGPADTTTAEIYDPGTGLWTPTGSMGYARTLFAVTRLPDGRVLAAGDLGTLLTEVYDPGTGLWTPTGNLAQARRYPSATLLPSGKVLLAGGYDSVHLTTTEVYDPATGQWTAGPPLQSARRRHAATMLPDGRVLVSGGQNPATLATAELVDVDAPSWATGNSMSTGRTEHTLTLLRDGEVLAAGGVASTTAEVRDLAGNWSTTGNTLAWERWQHTATLLNSGRVLLAGSQHSAAAGKTAEVYDPPTRTFALVGDMGVDRNGHTATLLPCGEVLVVGGHDSLSVAHISAERYNPLTGLWRPTGSLNKARWRHTATLLPDGRVLVTGGSDGAPLDSVEVYDPVAETWIELTNKMLAPRVHHTATLLPHGRVLLTGGQGAADSAEVFDPTTETFAASAAGPAIDRDEGFSATLLPNGRVLVVGGNSAPVTPETYDPALDSWIPMPATAFSHSGHGALVLLDGRVLVVGGGGGDTEIFDVGRGEQGWRPILLGATNPLVLGTPLAVTGSGFQGLSEGSTGLGYMQSASNYPLVQVHRLDNDAMEWLPLDRNKGWSVGTFDSLAVGRPHPGPARVTVFAAGMPSNARVVQLECPPPTITSSPTAQSICVGDSTTLDVVGSGECVTWQWRKGAGALSEAAPFSGTRTATLSITNASLGDAGLYDAVAESACSSSTSVSAQAALAVDAALSSVSAAPAGPHSLCTTCTGATVTESHTAGGAVTHQWGYRTATLGAIIDLPGRTGPSYELNGADFPGVGSYLLVVRTTPNCGTATVSNEIPVDITAAAPGDDVLYFTVTSRDSENVLEWVNPAGYDTVRIRYTTGDPCVYPVDPVLDGSLAGDKMDLDGPGDRDRFSHGGLTNDLPHCYTVFVDTGGGYSAGRSNRGRPFDTAGKVKWAFSTGVFSLTAPTVGGAGVIATSNDHVLHAMERGLNGGEWPAGWLPQALGDKVEGRSPIVPIDVSGANPVIYAGSFDGSVYVVDANAGGAAPLPWSPTPIASAVSAAPAGLFTDFGGGWDYLLVGTRNSFGTDNALYALDPETGGVVDFFDNGGGSGRIGFINGMASVDYSTGRVYFGSAEDPSGTGLTLWCLQLGSGPVFTPCWAPQRMLGSILSSPVLMGDRVYVGSLAGGGTIHSIDAASGAAAMDRSIPIVDGPVKGFVFPDRANNDVWFATDNAIWGVHDDGASLSVKFGAGFSLNSGVTPTSPVLFVPGSHYVYVGGSDGRLYELDTLGPAMRSIQLGDGQAAVGAPSLDWPNGLIHVGTEAGVFYAVEFPLP